MFNTVSARQIQREYKKILKIANESKEPIIVMANNKPLGAIIGLKQLEKIQLEAVLNEALNEYRAGKTKSIESTKDLEVDFEEMRKETNA